MTLHREEHLKCLTLDSKHMKTSMEEKIGSKLHKVSWYLIIPTVREKSSLPGYLSLRMQSGVETVVY